MHRPSNAAGLAPRAARSVSRLAPLLACVLLLTVELTTATAVSAQSAAGQYAGRPVDDVQLLVEDKPTTETTLLELVEIRVGQPLSIEAVRESIAHIYSLGRFQDVQVEAASGVSGGVTLRFNLIPFHNIRRVEFKGELGLSAGLLRETVAERYGASPSIGRVDAAVRTVQQLYADHGYLRAKVEASTEIAHAPDSAVLTFTIDSGPRAVIGRVVVARDTEVSREAIMRQIDAQPGQVFQRARIQERLDNYIRDLKNRRYYEADGSLQADPSDDGRTVDLVIAITTGLPVTVRFDFKGGAPVPADRLKELAPLEREGSVDEDLLEDSETRIENYLRQEGYWKADVTVRREPTDTGLTIVFEVDRGRQYRVAAPTEIRGVRAVPVGEVAALVALQPGELFVESKLSAGVAVIREFYRQRGFAAVDLKSGVNETDAPRTADASVPEQAYVRAAIVVTEGSQSTVGDVRILGATAIQADELRPLVKIAAGDAYFEPRIVDARDALIVE